MSAMRIEATSENPSLHESRRNQRLKRARIEFRRLKHFRQYILPPGCPTSARRHNRMWCKTNPDTKYPNRFTDRAFRIPSRRVVNRPLVLAEGSAAEEFDRAAEARNGGLRNSRLPCREWNLNFCRLWWQKCFYIFAGWHSQSAFPAAATFFTGEWSP